MKKFRIGSRKLARGLNRQLNRPLDAYSTRMLSGHRTPPLSPVSLAVRCFRNVVRSHKRLIKHSPEFFDFGAIDRQLREAEVQRIFQAEIKAAVGKVYGSAPPSNANSA